MGYVLKRLALGIALIGLAAAVLLVSDRQHRQRARPGGPAPAAGSRMVKVVPTPSRERTVMMPPCLRMIAWTMASPSPLPRSLVE